MKVGRFLELLGLCCHFLYCIIFRHRRQPATIIFFDKNEQLQENSQICIWCRYSTFCWCSFCIYWKNYQTENFSLRLEKNGYEKYKIYMTPTELKGHISHWNLTCNHREKFYPVQYRHLKLSPERKTKTEGYTRSNMFRTETMLKRQSNRNALKNKRGEVFARELYKLLKHAFSEKLLVSFGNGWEKCPEVFFRNRQRNQHQCTFLYSESLGDVSCSWLKNKEILFYEPVK